MIKIAFAGNPNVGKTALINEIAGSKLKIGNWPGVTVEKKEAEFEYNGETIKLVDLPGVYSLSPYSIEEKITRDYIIAEKPDLILNVVDSTNLERNLYLSTQLKEMGRPMLIALNLLDEFEKLGFKLNQLEFDKLIGIETTFTSATKKEGIQKVLDKAIETIKKNKEQKHISYELGFENIVEKIIDNTKQKINKNKDFDKVKQDFTLDFISIKLLEKDAYFYETLQEKYKIKDLSFINKNIKDLENKFDEDVETIFAEARYGISKGIVSKTLKKSLKGRLDFTDKIDKVLLNKFFGLFIFMFIMIGLFSITFNGSGPFIDFVDGFIGDYIGKYVAILIEGVPDWLNALVMDGIIGGVGGVLVFVPLMFFLFFFLAILEESGYMFRVAFLMDKVMKGIGLNGKAFVPLILGFGCTVPSIYATRTLESERSRRLTAMMAPFMSCGARLPVYALFTAAFFPKSTSLIVLILYLTGIGVAILTGLILKNHPYFKPDEKILLIELPPYRIPTFKMLMSSTLHRTKSYLKKASTVIMGVLIILWALTYFPNGGDAKNSFLGKSSRVIAPIFKPLGFADRWETVAAILPSIAAKEVVVGFMAQVLPIENSTAEETKEKTTFLTDTSNQIKSFFVAIKDSVVGMISFDVGSLFTPPSADEVEEEGSGVIKATSKLWENNSQGKLKAFSFMIFILLVVPCVVTLAAIKQEFGFKMLGIVILLLSLIPYIASTIIYQVGSLFL